MPLSSKQRIGKQIIIVVILLLIVSPIFVLGLYFLGGNTSTSPTGKQYEQLKLFNVRSLDVRSDSIDLLAEISNPNIGLGISNLPYRFTIYGEDGSEIKSVEGSTFILPDSTRYVLEQDVKVSSNFDRVEFNWGEAEAVPLPNYSSPEVFVIDDQYQRLDESKPGSASVTGLLANRTSFNLPEVELDILLSNQTGKIVGAGNTSLTDISNGEDRFFTLTWFYELPVVEGYDIFPVVNIFKNQNLLEKYQ